MNLLKKILGLTLASITPAFADSYKTDDGVSIDYEVVGEGAPLVLLHSGMMSREDMRGQIDYFSKYFMVIALDSREQGRSSSSDAQISYELMAADVVGLLDHLNVDKASFFGQSDGGITALIFSHLYPARVQKLAIHGAVYNKDAYPIGQREGWENITWDENAKGAKDLAGFPGMAISSYLLGQNDLSAFEAHLQEMAHMWATSPNLSKAEVASIETPTLVIVGDHWDISIAHTVEMHETLPNSELFIAPGATHFIHREKPDMLHKVLHDFLVQ